jgi:hypothetical protein
MALQSGLREKHATCARRSFDRLIVYAASRELVPPPRPEDIPFRDFAVCRNSNCIDKSLANGAVAAVLMAAHSLDDAQPFKKRFWIVSVTARFTRHSGALLILSAKR